MFVPFDIITSLYTDFKGYAKTDCKNNPEVSVFIVISVNADDTLTCCKLTSNRNAGVIDNNYYVSLASHPFLQCDSYIQIDKMHCVYADRARKIGSLADFCRRGFITKFTTVFGKFRVGLEKYAPSYVSPNIKF